MQGFSQASRGDFSGEIPEEFALTFFNAITDSQKTEKGLAFLHLKQYNHGECTSGAAARELIRYAAAPKPYGKGLCAVADRELKKLSRRELLEILIAQGRENERLQEEIRQMEARLNEREIRLAKSGSIAEAALQLSGIFEAAQRAADQYLENVSGGEIRSLPGSSTARPTVSDIEREPEPKPEPAAEPEKAPKQKRRAEKKTKSAPKNKPEPDQAIRRSMAALGITNGKRKAAGKARTSGRAAAFFAKLLAKLKGLTVRRRRQK